MMQKLWKYILIAAVLGAVYMLGTNHFLFYGKQVKLLPKAEFNLSETFINVTIDDLTSPKDFLRQNPESRRDGAGEVLVELELITDDELQKIESELDEEEMSQ